MSGIGKLQRVPLREVWKHEAHDFTHWLEQNVDVLNDVLDLTLVNIEREKKTESSFSIDLLAEDEGGGTVIIENQLEKSDHDHLGKLITYLAAMSARAAIWIVSEPRPEHVAAVSWLNEARSVRFYLLKVEAIRIGASAPAPLLTVIVEPGEALSAIGEANEDIDERYRIRQRWWAKLLAHDDAKLHAHITPGMYSWIGTSAGIRGLNYNYSVIKSYCSAELYIDRGRGKEEINRRIFERLLHDRQAIEQAYGGSLLWEALEAKRACRIKVPPLEGGYRSSEGEWEAIQAKQVHAMNCLHAALRPFVQALDVNDIEAEEDRRGEDELHEPA